MQGFLPRSDPPQRSHQLSWVDRSCLDFLSVVEPGAALLVSIALFALGTRQRESWKAFALDTSFTVFFFEIGWRGRRVCDIIEHGGTNDGDFTMTLAVRKRFVAGGVLLLIGLASVGVFVSWLETLGVLGWAQHVCDHFFTGTAITVIVALLILLPSGAVVAVCVQRCRVCAALLFRRGKYCSECGSRV